MQDHDPTQKQIALFTIVLSFIVSIIGTVLALGFFAPLFTSTDSSGPLFFNRARNAEKPPQDSEISRQSNAVVSVVEEAAPAVVSVVASKDVSVVEQYFVDPFENDPMFDQLFGGKGSGIQIPQYRTKGTERKDVSAGTGFLVSADGMIVTNKHVVEDKKADYTILMNDGRKVIAKVLAVDPVQDLAILKIEGSNYSYLKLGDSANIKIGQTVIAIGNALGEFRNTVSTGIISGLQRTVVANGAADGPESLEELIQSDAAINPGNSGGPLINLSGEVIGINTAIAKGAENIGFAIPVNKVKRDIASVRQSGKIIYPFLGVRYVVVTKELADKEKLGRNYGAWVKGIDKEPAVVKDSPAEKAGLKEGDIVLKVNNEAINLEKSLASLIQKYNVGDEITLRIFKEGKEVDVKVKLEERK